jgi:predicted CoA-substrate-specific enzyme activase
MDLGSRVIKIVYMNGKGMRSMISYDTVEFYKSFGRLDGKNLRISFEKLGLATSLTGLTVTGYGRNTINIKDAEVISEIKAHTLGAVHQSGLHDFTLLDIGGQDTKVVHVVDGRMEDFVMNDKCAASSGRYIENMARVLGLNLSEISRYFHNPVKLSSTCAIFGESELVQRITEGADVAELAAGVNLSIVKRVLPLVGRYPEGPIIFSGGVANNKAIAAMIHVATDREIIPLPDPAFNGALGCAIYAKAG